MLCLTLQEVSRPGRFGLSQVDIPLDPWITRKFNNFLLAGTSSGLGRCLAKTVLKRGDRVIATARDISRIEDLCISGAYVMQLDVRDEFSVIQRKAAEAIKVYGRIDVVGK